MSELQHELISHCLAYFGEVQDRYSSMPGRTELISHTGDLSETDLQAILESIEKTGAESGDKPTVVKRLFSVMVESLQNLRAHGARSEQGTMATCVVVGVDEEHYLVDTGNPVAKNEVDGLKARIEKINVMERQELRAFYMNVLSDGSRSEKGGAGLGLITIVLRSMNPIEFAIDKINGEYCYLKLGFRIDRT